MQFGDEIQVNGVRPAWLKDGVILKWNHGYGFQHATTAENLNWAGTYSQPRRVTHIRLPVDHFAYQAIAAGFEPWAGGDAAPDDWDGGAVLWRNGQIEGGDDDFCWGDEVGVNDPDSESPWDTIGYRKQSTAQPATTDDFHAEALRTLQDATRRIAELSAPPADDRLTIRITGPQASGKTRWAEMLRELAPVLSKAAGFPRPVVLDDGEAL